VPRCSPEDASAQNPPCRRLAADAASCPNADHLAVAIEGKALLPADARVRASCIIKRPS
jgi:hypothetical protein